MCTSRGHSAHTGPLRSALVLLTDNDTGFWCSGASEKRYGASTEPKTARIRQFVVRIANNALPARSGSSPTADFPALSLGSLYMDTINFLNSLQPLMDPLTNPYAPGATASSPQLML